jgi:hypothetical protein
MRRWTFAAVLGAGLTALAYQVLAPVPVAARHVPITTKIVFNREIAQIFQKKCFQCHTDGNVSMALTTYKEARPWAVAIKEEILDRKMPPWSAAGGYGHFANDMSLTAREMSLILSWADGGAPSGVLLVDEDKQPVYVPSLGAWEQGEPDAVVKVAETTKVPLGAPFKVERFEIATGLKQAQWLRALQVKPSDRRVVRYAAVYESRSGRWLGTWTPSSQVSAMPSGSAVQLPAAAKLTVEVGYRGHTDEEGSGAGEVGMYFAAGRPGVVPSAIELAAAAPVNIAAGKTGERVRAETVIKAPASIAALWPKPGVGARSLELTAVRPDGRVEPMLWLNDYRAEWPTSYVLKEPVHLPAGTRLIATTYYDNTTGAALAARPSVSITAVPQSRRPATLEP